MYKDEYGNIWASYEDYQEYLNVASQISSLSTDMLEAVIKGKIEEENEKVESGQSNE